MDDRKITLRLNSKKQSGFGIVSFVLGILACILFLAAVSMSAFADRGHKAVVYGIGIMGILGTLVSVIGILHGLIGESSKDTFKTFAHIGIGINLTMLIIHGYIIYSGYFS
ncbi:hypothetical protein HZI73_19835 [Vallitalea pronyensis]|uniref:Uncharacterized protein n=1 Tax=Vallitalea pronyensis TaxID=1348613 RepID=A0A8J8MMW7_9FIRM|nr:DUF6142 family protein [Vallitalea pronyensis]QUI24409.1 hypothetical protein HZI73_19835 [Vallitalea pronyensis]